MAISRLLRAGLWLAVMMGVGVPAAQAQFNAEGLMRDMVGVIAREAAKSGAANAQSAVAGASDDLTRAQAWQLQEQLNRLGYDVGKPDGVVGRKTKAAVVDFLDRRGMPQDTSWQDAYQAVMSASPSAEAPTPRVAEAEPAGGLDALRALAGETPSGEAGSVAQPPPDDAFTIMSSLTTEPPPEIVRMMIGAKPSMLDNEKLLRELFELEGRRFTSTYRVEDELAAFKAEYLARPVPAVTYLNLGFAAYLHQGDYRRDVQLFPLDISTGDDSEIVPGFLNFSVLLDDRYEFSFKAAGLRAIDGLTMTLEEAEAFERDRMKRGIFSAFVHRRVGITAVRYDETRDIFEGDLTLYSVEVVDDDGAVLRSWPVDTPDTDTELPPETASVATLEELAGILPAIKLVDGYLDLSQPGWQHVAASLLLAKQPESITDIPLLMVLGRGLLTETEQHALWRGQPPSEWTNLDDYRGLDLERVPRLIYQEYGETISSRAIDPQVKVVDIIAVRLGGYDAAAGVLKLDHQERNNPLISDEFAASLGWEYGRTILPRALPVDQAMAQSIIAMYGGDPTGQVAHLAVFAEADDVTLERGGSRTLYGVSLVARPSRIVLYKDAGLSELIFDYTADPNGWLESQQRGEDELDALVDMPKPSVDVMHRIAIDASGDPAYTDDLIAYTMTESRLNEFEKIDQSERIRTGLVGTVVPEPFWLAGEVGLGEYSLGASAFALRNDSFRLEYQGSAFGIAGGAPEVALINPITSLPVPTDVARSFIERSDEYRKVKVRLMVTPVHAVVDRTRRGEVKPTITFHLERLVVLAAGAKRGTTEKLADIDYGPYAGLGTTTSDESEEGKATLPERPLFDPELAALMRYSLGDKALSDDQYRRVLVSRWLAEQNVDFDPSIVHRFFPPGAPLPAAASFDLYRKDFEAWMGSMGPLAPSKLRVKVDFTDKVSTDRLPSQCNEMEWTHRYLENGWRLARSLFGDEGEALLDSQLRHIGDSSDDKPAVVENFLLGFPRAALVECEIDATKDIFYSMFEGSMPQSAYLIVDKLPAPNFLSNSPYNAAMLDLAVTNVEMVQVADGPAVMVVRATLESAEWQATSINQNQLVVNDRRSFSRESLEPEQLGLDLLGIRLGISENEADQLVRAYMAEPMVLKSVVDFSPNTPAFSDTTVYVSADGHEGIALIYEAGTGERRVLGVTRKIYAPGWGLSRTDVTASVLKKYGQPAFEEVSEYSSILAWGPGSGGRYCREVDSGWRVLDNWVNETGQTGRIPDFMDWGEARSSGVVALPEPNWNDELVRCEGLVLLRHDENRVTTTLIDPAAYYKAWQRSLQMAQELIDKKVDEGGAPVIAF